jgi:RNA polymerase sigma factor (sigma-70 family)
LSDPLPDSQLEGLFHRYAAGLGNYFLARVGNVELAEELTSRVFVQAVAHFDQCRGNTAGWLWAIAQTVLTRYGRERGRVIPAPVLPVARGPDEAAEISEMQARLPEVLASLSEQQQLIVYLKYFQDANNGEIARATGVTPENVAVILHRTLKKLRDLMSEPHAPEETVEWPKRQKLMV